MFNFLIYFLYLHCFIQEVDEGYSTTTVKRHLSNTIVILLTLDTLREREPVSGSILQTLRSYYQDLPDYVSHVIVSKHLTHLIIVPIQSNIPPPGQALCSCQGGAGGLHLVDGPPPCIWSHIHSGRLPCGRFHWQRSVWRGGIQPQGSPCVKCKFSSSCLQFTYLIFRFWNCSLGTYIPR